MFLFSKFEQVQRDSYNIVTLTFILMFFKREREEDEDLQLVL